MQRACSVETAVVCRRDVVSQERFGSAARLLLESGRASPRSEGQRESMIVAPVFVGPWDADAATGGGEATSSPRSGGRFVERGYVVSDEGMAVIACARRALSRGRRWWWWWWSAAVASCERKCGADGGGSGELVCVVADAVCRKLREVVTWCVGGRVVEVVVVEADCSLWAEGEVLKSHPAIPHQGHGRKWGASKSIAAGGHPGGDSPGVSTQRRI